MLIRRCVALAIAGAVSVANADNLSRADELFAEGKALMETDLHAGCAKLEESLALNPQAVGTVLNVALCDVRLGRLATAAEHFARARDMAREQGMREHLEAAEAHLQALEPRLPRVTFSLAEPLPETRIVVHDRLLPPSGWVDVPLDPGEHSLVVTAPGRLAFRTTIRIAEGERHDVVVPALARSRSATRPIGKVTMAAGGTLILTGVVIGFISGRRYDDALDGCLVGQTETRCDDPSYDKIHSARNLGNVGTVVTSVGVVAAGVGVYLWLRGPRRHNERSLTVVPQLDGDGGGIAAIGRF